MANTVHDSGDGAEHRHTELTEHDDAGGRRTFHLAGSRIDSIATFYDELNRTFMTEEDWEIGQSLDALNDLLHGGIGALRGAGPATVVWDDFEHSREALGFAATRAWLQEKIDQPRVFNAPLFQRRLEDVEAGHGTTYIDLVLEVFAGHPEIGLDLR